GLSWKRRCTLWRPLVRSIDFRGAFNLVGEHRAAGVLRPCSSCNANRSTGGPAPRMKTTVGRSQIVPGVSTIREAQRFLAKYFAPTRLIFAPFLSQRTGKNVYLKLEMELPTGSFKVRGAVYALAQRMNRGPIEEVVACSTGNHGAAVAYAAKQFGIKAKIFLPTNCNPVKRERISALGAAMVESGGGDLASAFTLAAEYAKQP